MTTHLGESTILEIGINYLDELCVIGYEIKIPLIQSMSAYLSGQNTYEQSKQTFLSIIGRTEPLDRLKEIVDMAEEPSSEPGSSSSPPSTFIQSNAPHYSSSDTDADNSNKDDPPYVPPGGESSSNGTRKKTRSWSPQEDTKLLAGIYKYGVDNWTTISSFIGNGRTRAQCCQRWTRGLNPRVSKNLWSYEEDLRLVQLVFLYGDKSWTKIASMMGNRSDVQCRYHYRQVMRDMPPLLKNPFNFPHSSNLDKTIPHEYEEIKSAIEGILPSRYSMPQFSNNDIDPSQQFFKAQNMPTPSLNFVSFAQNSQNQVNFQQPVSHFSSNVSNNVLMRPVLSLPSFDNEASIFDINSAPAISETPNVTSPNIYPNLNGSPTPTPGSNMQLILNGGFDAKVSNTPIIRPKSNSISSTLRSKIELPDQPALQAKNSSPIPALSSFCSLSEGGFDNGENSQARRRDSAPSNNQEKKLKFPSPKELELEVGCAKSFSGPNHLDNFLNDFR